MSSAVVIGGGVIGAACAHYLLQRGWQVTILEADRWGSACSHGNCGLICPSHVLPLAEPGAVRKTLAAMLSPRSPFAIKPRFDPTLWSWLVRFARRCNRRDMLDTGRALHGLLESSFSLYQALLEEESWDCQWQSEGLLYVYRTAAAMDGYAATDRLLAEEFNMPARRLDGDQLQAFDPALKSGLAGGWFYPEDAHLRPDRLLSAWRARLERHGAAIVEHCRATEFAAEHGLASSVLTTRGAYPADAFVVATGALAPEWQRQLGCRIPIQPGKGYSITMPRPQRCPRVPMLLAEDKVGVTPMPSGYRLGSTMEFAGYDQTIHPRRLALLRDGAARYLHEPFTEPVEETWYGWRPMTFDSKPIIDRSPRLKNAWLAAGHSMLGLTLAPATGRLVAEMICGERPHVAPEPFAASRF